MEKELLSPKIDIVFKCLFGKPKNEELTKSMLIAILKRRITNIELDLNTNLIENWKKQKLGILDIRAKINDVINCNIEIQIEDKYNIEKRILYYWSKLYSQKLEKSENYLKLEPTISILILNYELKNLKQLKKFHTTWKIREEEYVNKILIEDLEIHIIELPKFKKIKDKINIEERDMLFNWLTFIENPKGEEVKNIMGKCREIKQAMEELEYISGDNEIRYIAELRRKGILDENTNLIGAREEGIFKGINIGKIEGLKEGKKEGISIGKRERNIEIAKKMLNKNIDINIIIDVTGLNKKEIENLKITI